MRLMGAALVAVAAAVPAWAVPRSDVPEVSSLQRRGAEVRMALLIEYYNELPRRGARDEDPQAWAARYQAGVEKFKRKVEARYTEGTLQRILGSTDVTARRAAVLALGMVGTMRSAESVARMLRDEDRLVRRMAADACWSLWFRGDTEANCRELQRIMRMNVPAKAVAGLDALIRRAPRFAEAYNQRAIRYFQMEEYDKSAADCEAALKLNPHHFGAQAGLAQCHMKLHRARPALKAFRKALQINPDLEGVGEAIQFLEDALGEEGKRDDKK